MQSRVDQFLNLCLENNLVVASDFKELMTKNFFTENILNKVLGVLTTLDARLKFHLHLRVATTLEIFKANEIVTPNLVYLWGQASKGQRYRELLLKFRKEEKSEKATQTTKRKFEDLCLPDFDNHSPTQNLALRYFNIAHNSYSTRCKELIKEFDQKLNQKRVEVDQAMKEIEKNRNAALTKLKQEFAVVVDYKPPDDETIAQKAWEIEKSTKISDQNNPKDGNELALAIARHDNIVRLKHKATYASEPQNLERLISVGEQILEKLREGYNDRQANQLSMLLIIARSIIDKIRDGSKELEGSFIPVFKRDLSDVGSEKQCEEDSTAYCVDAQLEDL